MFHSHCHNKLPHVYAPKPIKRITLSKLDLTNSLSKSQKMLSNNHAKTTYPEENKALTLGNISLNEIDQDFIHFRTSMADSDSIDEILTILNNRDTCNTPFSIEFEQQASQGEIGQIERSPNPFVKSILFYDNDRVNN